MGVYIIKNLKTKKVYVGSTTDLHKRKAEHFRDLERDKHHCKHLQRSFNLYNSKYFIFCVLEYVYSANILLEREQQWFRYYGVGDHARSYNTAKLSGASMKGLKPTEETKKLFSQIRKGRKFSEEHKEKLRRSNTGQKRSLEQKKRIREAILSHGFTEKQRQVLKRRNDTYKGGNNPNAKKVLCIETNKVFNTIQEALEYSG